MDHVITLDLTFWAFLGGTIVPILVGVVRGSSAARGIANLVLSAISGLIATAMATDGVLTKTAVVAGVMSLITSVGAYYGFLKPSGISASVQKAAGNVGTAHTKPTVGY